MPQRKRTTEKHLKNRSGEENADSGQLEKDRDGSIGQSGVVTSGLWPMLHWE